MARQALRTTARLRHGILAFGLLLTVVWGMASCNRKTVYHHYEHTPRVGWEKVDIIAFDVPGVSEDGLYKEELGLRTDDTYPFMGLSLVIRQTILPSGYVHYDTLNCSLIGKNGNSKGAGISYYQSSFHFNTLRLQKGDSLHVVVKHNMKREIMTGIADVGLKLERQ